MIQHVTRLVLFVACVLLGLYLVEPYTRSYFLSASAPRAIEPRGALADFERTSIALFERVSPAVVQVVVLSDRASPFDSGQGGTELRAEGTGTGFVWDSAGNVVTNAHVVGRAQRVAIRTASGDFAAADVIGVAPSYDIAVVRAAGRSIPPPIPVGSSSDLKVDSGCSPLETRSVLIRHSPLASSAPSSDGFPHQEGVRFPTSFRRTQQSTPAIPVDHCSILLAA